MFDRSPSPEAQKEIAAVKRRLSKVELRMRILTTQYKVLKRDVKNIKKEDE